MPFANKNANNILICKYIKYFENVPVIKTGVPFADEYFTYFSNHFPAHSSLGSA